MQGTPIRNRAGRRGSMMVVLWIAVVLLALGGASAVLTSSLGRRDHHQALRESAFDVARASAEEAALLINNGRVNVALEQGLGTAEPIPVESPMIDGGSLEAMGLDPEARPEVRVRASVVGPESMPKKPPLEQLEEIQQEIETRGYDPEMYTRLTEFWERVEREGIQDDGLTSDFWSMAGNVDVARWGPPKRTRTNDDGTTEIVSANKLPELLAVYEMFYTVGADGTSGSRSGKPSAAALKPAWEAAMRAVGKESATRMESCGSNPNLAMSHLVGDLKTGEAIASGTEVDITSAFMKSRELGANKTYLLEITASMAYGSPRGATKMRGTAEYTTYRLFQKAEWEAAVQHMTEALVRSLRNHGMTDAELAAMFPAEPDEDGRDAPLPGGSLRYDPKKVVADPVFEELPSTVGARLYPYSVANGYPAVAMGTTP